MQSTLDAQDKTHDGGLQDTGLHVAIIMDGNGRWAERRSLSRSAGHREGIEAVRRVVEAAPDLGIAALTLFAFSADNWRRPPFEVEVLMLLLKQYLRRDVHRLVENGVRLKVIGRRDRLPDGLAQEIAAAEVATARNFRLDLTVAIDYSGRDAIANAAAIWLGDNSPERHSFTRLLARLGHGAGRDVDLMFAPAARSASRTSCCGNAPTPSSSSPRRCGRISGVNISALRLRNFARASVASAACRPRARRRRRWQRRAAGRDPNFRKVSRDQELGWPFSDLKFASARIRNPA